MTWLKNLGYCTTINFVTHTHTHWLLSGIRTRHYKRLGMWLSWLSG